MSRPSTRPTPAHLVAGLWGFAEATCFFLVPDVWLTRVALRTPRRAYAACLSATGAAVVGGAATWAWGRRTPAATSRAVLTRLPAIDDAMVDRVEGDLAGAGLRSLLRGPTRGVPYKVYARTAGLRRDPLGRFLAWSVPARLPRFVVVTTLAVGLRAGAVGVLGEHRTARLDRGVHAAAWVAFYAWYFRTVGRGGQDAGLDSAA